jgi:hypothetical protein
VRQKREGAAKERGCGKEERVRQRFASSCLGRVVASTCLVVKHAEAQKHTSHVEATTRLVVKHTEAQKHYTLRLEVLTKHAFSFHDWLLDNSRMDASITLYLHMLEGWKTV